MHSLCGFVLAPGPGFLKMSARLFPPGLPVDTAYGLAGGGVYRGSISAEARA